MEPTPTCSAGKCVCPAGNAASNGTCCPTGQTGCGGACVDTQTDPSNCGDCAVACATTCTAGLCD
jgi:hypothetical protein